MSDVLRLYIGAGKVWSNDYVRSGCIDLTPMSQMGAGGRYLGPRARRLVDDERKLGLLATVSRSAL